MSVLIKGMEMPSECEYCGFCRFYPENGNVWCNAKNKILKTKWKEPNWTHLDVKRPDWCPLVELPKGEWLRMSDLSEKDDNRYKCSRCGNVILHKSRMDLYTFNSWCGRCGSDNSIHTTIIEADKWEEDAPMIEAEDGTCIM